MVADFGVKLGHQRRVNAATDGGANGNNWPDANETLGIAIAMPPIEVPRLRPIPTSSTIHTTMEIAKHHKWEMGD